MIKLIRKIFSLFTQQERSHILLLFTGIVVRSIVEVAGVASIMPFIAVVSNPDVIFTNTILSFVYSSLGLESARAFLLILGGAVFVLILLTKAL